MNLYVAYVQWDRDHQSPPLGPFEGHTQAEAGARRIRKALREGGHSRPNVKLSVLLPEEAAAGWLTDEEAGRRFAEQDAIDAADAESAAQ